MAVETGLSWVFVEVVIGADFKLKKPKMVCSEFNQNIDALKIHRSNV